jgi:Sulfotransferase family
MFESKTLLIGVGAQKAATTWLATYLASHPEVYVPEIKELHYFDYRFGPEFVPRKQLQARFSRRMENLTRANERDGGLNQEVAVQLEMANDRLAMFQGEIGYMDFFRKRVGEQKVFGEITPGYQMLDASIFGMMNEMHPQVRFIFIMRDPIDRTWSQYRMVQMVERKVGQPGRRMDFTEALSHRLLVPRTDYKRTIEELEKAVPKERIHYLFYEDMFTPEAMKEVTAFLGVKEWPAKFAEKSNTGPEVAIDPDHAKAAFQRFRYVYDFVADRFDGRLPQHWRETMARYS